MASARIGMSVAHPAAARRCGGLRLRLVPPWRHARFDEGSTAADNGCIMRLDTISEAYRKLQQDLHTNPNYGVASLQFAPIVADIIRQSKARSISDYGAGKKNLLKGLAAAGITGFDYYPYDPAFPEYGEPKPADLVCCIDVLEHIELEFLPSILQDLRDITIKHGFFTVHTGKAEKVLTDGRNAHLIQQPASWWLPKMCEHFEIEHVQRATNGFWLLVEPLRPR
jgi:hypothetical protein